MKTEIRYYVAASIPAWQDFARGAIARGETLAHFLAGVHEDNQTNARAAFLSVQPRKLAAMHKGQSQLCAAYAAHLSR